MSLCFIKIGIIRDIMHLAHSHASGVRLRSRRDVEIVGVL